MKKFALFLLPFVIVHSAAQRPKYAPSHRSPVAGEQSISIEQLEQALLLSSKGVSDDWLAYQIDSLDLNERLSPARLARLQQQVHGRQAKQSLVVLADRSVFSPPPSAELLSLPAPDLDAQKKMIGLTSQFVITTLHQMPDFYATRTTTTFGRSLKADNPMQSVGKHKVTVYYRNGSEEIELEKHQRQEQGLTTRGEFGPILALALLDAAKGHLQWSRWEQGLAGPVAVYSYAIPAANSHYQVNGKNSAYKGEISVDPNTGVIIRLILRADGEPGPQLKAADVDVEYGQVNFDGKIYVCPQRSIALSQGDQLVWLNESVFEKYHLFHSDSRIVQGTGGPS